MKSASGFTKFQRDHSRSEVMVQHKSTSTVLEQLHSRGSPYQQDVPMVEVHGVSHASRLNMFIELTRSRKHVLFDAVHGYNR